LSVTNRPNPKVGAHLQTSSTSEVGAFEAKNTLGTLLDRVERGEEIVITPHGKPVARLVPNIGRMEPKSDLGRAPWLGRV